MQYIHVRCIVSALTKNITLINFRGNRKSTLNEESVEIAIRITFLKRKFLRHECKNWT